VRPPMRMVMPERASRLMREVYPRRGRLGKQNHGHSVRRGRLGAGLRGRNACSKAPRKF
jgi:hypothetical protein